MSLQQLKELAVKDEEVIQKLEEEKTEIWNPDLNEGFQSFIDFLLDLEEVLEDVEDFRGGSYLIAFQELKNFDGVPEEFRAFEEEASKFMSSRDLQKLDKLNRNFEEYKKDACVELLEKAIENGKKRTDKIPTILMEQKTLEKAFDYVSQQTDETGKECAGIFVTHSRNENMIVCQEFRPLNDSEINSLEKKGVTYEDDFIEKLRKKEEYGYSLMHSHPTNNIETHFEVRLMPSSHASGGVGGGDLEFFKNNDLTLNFIISTSGKSLPNELYISAVGMPIGPIKEKTDLRNEIIFHPINVVNEGKKVETPETKIYNRLACLYNGSDFKDIDKIYGMLGEYRSVILS